MSTSNLALLDRAVKTAVAHELGEPVGDDGMRADINPQRYRRVAGLRVGSNAARDAATNSAAATLFRSLNQFCTDAKILNAKLAHAGVVPIAVLPLTTWTQLCDRTELYRFNPDKDGQVRIATKTLTDAKAEAAVAKVKSPSPGWCTLVPPVVLGLSAWFLYLGLDIAITFLFGAVVTVFGFVGVLLELDARRNRIRQQLEEPILRAKIAKAIEGKTIHDLLWPEYREPEAEKNNATIRIALPEPPADVQETLVSAERCGVTLRLAVVGDAITFRDDPGDALMNYRKREIAEQPTGLHAWLDPIVYVVEGRAVAIIAQFGDFPIEKEVIKEVIDSVHLA